jgi:hypothetical protein
MTAGAFLAPAAGAATHTDTPDPGGDPGVSAPAKPAQASKHSTQPAVRPDSDNDDSGAAGSQPGKADPKLGAHQTRTSHQVGDAAGEQAGSTGRTGKGLGDEDSEYSQPQSTHPRHTRPVKPVGDSAETTTPRGTAKGADTGAAEGGHATSHNPVTSHNPATGGAGAGKSTGVDGQGSTPGITNESPDGPGPVKPSHSVKPAAGEQTDDPSVAPNSTTRPHRPLMHRPLMHRPLMHRPFGPRMHRMHRIHRIPGLRHGYYRPGRHLGEMTPADPTTPTTPGTTGAPRAHGTTGNPSTMGEHPTTGTPGTMGEHPTTGTPGTMGEHATGEHATGEHATTGTPATLGERGTPGEPGTAMAPRRTHRLHTLRHHARPMHRTTGSDSADSIKAQNIGEGPAPTTSDSSTTPDPR